MTTKTDLEPVAAAAPVIYEPPATFEVVDRGIPERFKFDQIGDSFVGIFEYTDEATNDEGEKFPVAVFTGPDGKPWSISPGASLERAVKRMEPGRWYRVTYTKAIDTGKPSPLKSFVVEAGAFAYGAPVSEG